jgi:hypothetical protein
MLTGENRGVDGDDNGLLRGVCDIFPNLIAHSTEAVVSQEEFKVLCASVFFELSKNLFIRKRFSSSSFFLRLRSGTKFF